MDEESGEAAVWNGDVAAEHTAAKPWSCVCGIDVKSLQPVQVRDVFRWSPLEQGPRATTPEGRDELDSNTI